MDPRVGGAGLLVAQRTPGLGLVGPLPQDGEEVEGGLDVVGVGVHAPRREPHVLGDG